MSRIIMELTFSLLRCFFALPIQSTEYAQEPHLDAVNSGDYCLNLFCPDGNLGSFWRMHSFADVESFEQETFEG